MLDPESGLYYYGGRYYDPELGRFISPDPFVGQPDDSQNLNRYSYVVNNPVNGIDPDGYHHIVKKKKKGGLFGKIFGGLKIVFGIFQLLTGNPMGFFNIASGASSFSNSRGALIFSHITGFVGALSSLPSGEGPPGGGGGSPFGSSLFNLSPALHGGDDGGGGGGLGGFGVFTSLGGEVFSLVNTLRSQRPGDDSSGGGPPVVLAAAAQPLRCEDLWWCGKPPPPKRLTSKDLQMSNDPTIQKCASCIDQVEDPTEGFTCNAYYCKQVGDQIQVESPAPDPRVPSSEKIKKTKENILKILIRRLFGPRGAE